MNYKKAIIDVGIPVLSVVFIAVLWIAAASAVGSEYVLPTPSDTFAAMIKLFGERAFYVAFSGTLLRTLIAFSIAFLLAFITAYSSYKSVALKRFFAPVIAIIRALPTIAIVLLLLVWTNSRVAPMIVTLLVVYPTLHNNLYAALCGIDGELTEMCKVFGVPKGKRLKKVIFPQIAPEFITSFGAGFTLNLKLMVAAEVISQTARSMGYLLNTSKVYFEISTMIALVVVTVITGLIVEGIFTIVAKRVGGVK
ncbi:MAG: ABC transporter permease subunit [Clostridia bacterium]|nr:ABC transporter permease subunit [Clostridia bacterium]